MEKKAVIGLGLLFVALIVIIGSIYLSLREKENNKLKDEDKSNVPSEDISYDNLDLDYEYQGENRWTYTVTGYLPNPCYKISTEAIVMESYPEQVIIKSIITPPEPEMICAQAILDVLEEGEFEASEMATVRFEVE